MQWIQSSHPNLNDFKAAYIDARILRQINGDFRLVISYLFYSEWRWTTWSTLDVSRQGIFRNKKTVWYAPTTNLKQSCWVANLPRKVLVTWRGSVEKTYLHSNWKMLLRDVNDKVVHNFQSLLETSHCWCYSNVLPQFLGALSTTCRFFSVHTALMY